MLRPFVMTSVRLPRTVYNGLTRFTSEKDALKGKVISRAVDEFLQLNLEGYPEKDIQEAKPPTTT